MAFFKFRKGGDAKTVAAPSPQESIETMRRRAKHRLVGASVLVLVAVVGFPILFDSQPRPVSVDIPIEIPDKNKVKPLAIPALATTPALANLPVAPPVASLGASAAAPSKSSATQSKEVMDAAASIGSKDEVVAAKPATTMQEKPAATAADDGARAQALLEGKDPDKAPVVVAETRFVVQVGAFADADKAMEVRQKLERAGLKTYAQVVDTKDGKRTRVRVGPFADKVQAEQTAEKVKAMDLPVAVLAL